MQRKNRDDSNFLRYVNGTIGLQALLVVTHSSMSAVKISLKVWPLLCNRLLLDPRFVTCHILTLLPINMAEDSTGETEGKTPLL